VIEVLKGIDLTIFPGEMMAVEGASGAGKSTLLHILGTLDRATEGKVLFQGIDLLGRSAGLPRAISGHQNYYLWRAPGPTPGIFIAVGFEESELAPWFERVEWAGEVRCDLCMPDRRVTRIYLGRGLVLPLDEFWPLAKCWTCDEPRFALERPPRER